MDEYRVGAVQDMSSPDFRSIGFNITTKNGKPLVSIRYVDHPAATKAHELIKQAIAEATTIIPYP